MKQIDIRRILEERSPQLLQKWPHFLQAGLFHLLKLIIHEKEMNAFLAQHADKQGIALIDEFFEYLDFSYSLSNRDKEKIPAEGRIIVVANHPLGGLDGLAILRAIKEVRPDVRIVVNDVLMQVENLNQCFLPFNILSKQSQKGNLLAIGNSLQHEEAVIFFPAGEVSRLTWHGIRDGRWLKGPAYLARKYKASILPVHVRGRNSYFFYFFSLCAKKISMFLLPHEIFLKKGKTLPLRVGNPIPAKVFAHSALQLGVEIKLLRRHLFRLAAKKKGLYKTENTIIHPMERRLLKTELEHSQLLGATTDGKKVFLVSGQTGLNTLLEVARLRELTFRKVGEGTGRRMDMDAFDAHYRHIVLWDEKDLEIVGSYRIGLGREILARQGVAGFYSNTLFEYDPAFLGILEKGVELGRSFVQEKYWNSRALDCLWQGIGTFLNHYPEIQYLIGPVSMSNSYPDVAKDLLVFYFSKWFGGPEGFVASRSPYQYQQMREMELKNIFQGQTCQEDYRTLKTQLKQYGCSVPVLYRHYSELSELGGVRFLDFNVDQAFQNCIDGLILVDVALISPAKHDRYFIATRKA
jgi:putative hemolysin